MPLLCWRRCLCCVGAVALLHWHCCPSCTHSRPCPYAPTTRHPSIIAALALLLRWHLCQRCLGLVTVSALAFLRMLPWRRCHRCRHGAGVIVVLALAPLPSLLSWSWCCCGHCAGAVANAAWALSPLQCWRHCGRCPGAVAIVAVMALASLRLWPGLQHSSQRRASPLLHPCPRQHHARVVTFNAPASLPAVCWHLCPCCAGAVAFVTLALLP